MAKLFVGYIAGGRAGNKFRKFEEAVEIDITNAEAMEAFLDEADEEDTFPTSLALNSNRCYEKAVNELNTNGITAQYDVYGEGVIVMSKTADWDKIELMALRCFND